MAENKKTIVVYSDWEEYFIDLSDEEAGKLIKHFFAYVKDKNPQLNDRFLEMAFKPIKNQLKRDLIKWEETKKKRSDAGRLGGKASGESRKQSEPKEASASFVKQNEANEAVNDTCNNMLHDNVSGNVNGIKKYIINNGIFLKESISSEQWIEAMASKYKITLDGVKFFLPRFEEHLITMEEQKESLKDFKIHFSNWMIKQDVSMFHNGYSGKTNQI